MAVFLDNSDIFAAQSAMQRTVGTDFPTGEQTFVWQVFLTQDRAASFQTYLGFAQTSFLGGSEYLIHAFDGSGGVSNNFAIGSEGNDNYSPVDQYPLLPSSIVGRWVRMCFRRIDTGGGTYDMEFYPDLTVSDGHVTRVWTGGGGALAPASGAIFGFGAPPYTQEEGMVGRLRMGKGWSRLLTLADCKLEAFGGENVVTSSSNIYGVWPFVSDGNDVSGQGRHLTNVQGGTVVFDGVANPPAATNLRNDFSLFPRTSLRHAA